MDPIREIAGLTAHRGRAAGTDAERRAAMHLRARLRALGRDVELQSTEVRPRFALAHTLHALLAILGSVVAVGSAAVGTALVGLAAVSTVLDLTGVLHVTRRLTGRRASQNLESREDGGKPGVLVLVAHYDAGRIAPSFNLATRLLRDPWLVMVLAILTVLGCCALRVAGVEGTGVTAAQFVPTVLLIFLVPPLADGELSGVAPGATDNATGVATVLRLADELGGRLEHFDLWVVLTGAQKPFALGMKRWLRLRRRELHPERTALLNVDRIGPGPLRFTRREGPLRPLRAHRQLGRICADIAEDDGEDGVYRARPHTSREPSDAWAAIARGIPALTISCEGSLVDPAAVERAQAFCRELIERLDAEIGPRLAARPA